jgi:inhibitor of KinA
VAQQAIEFLPCGDCAFSVQFGDRIDRDLSKRVLALHSRIRKLRLLGVLETVPTFRSLIVHYDPLVTSQAVLIDLIVPIAASNGIAEVRGAQLRLPVCYDPVLAYDLPGVAATTGLDINEIQHLHTGTLHYAYMVGFAPGHPYLGDLPEQLVLSRRHDPRARVDAGTVAIAVGLTVVYPFANPCGWHVIGVTPVRLFDSGRSRPALVSAGDTVECYAVSLEEFGHLQGEIAAGRYAIERVID